MTKVIWLIFKTYLDYFHFGNLKKKITLV